MDNIGLNKILEREKIVNEMKQILTTFDENKKNINFKKGIYIYGSPGCGKTEFVMNLLNEMNYDVIKYDAGDVRNKSLIETITSNNVSNRNVLDMMKGRVKKIAIVMDEIDGMNNGDKGGITSLIKLIRQKKTKKQKLENMTINPIVCIGNYYVDKKIKELMKVCNVFELKSPTAQQTNKMVDRLMPYVSKQDIFPSIMEYIQGDLRKFSFLYRIYTNTPNMLNQETLSNIFHLKLYNEDSKKITQSLINEPVNLNTHMNYVNETDRTIVALLFHENIIDPLANLPTRKTVPVYLTMLKNMCFADYVDRITFQKQIWQFNEMSFMIKTFHNNKIYHTKFPENRNKFHPPIVRFTKILTKYSTEYNNQLFLFTLCQELDMDKKDMIAFFQELRIFFGKDLSTRTDILNEVEALFQDYNIRKLDIKRIYRYLDKNGVKTAEEEVDLGEDED